jgi:perosamine synthetase
LGTLSCFSFYANKLLTTGEGGMLLCDDDALAERARRLRNLGFQPRRRFLHEEFGFNFRLTNLQAALGLTQVDRMDEIVARKRQMAARYAQSLSRLPGIELQVEQPWAKSVYWMYGLVLDEDTGLNAAQFAERLRSLGVETRPFFLGMHEQPVLLQRGFFAGERYPVAERIARQGLYLPSGLALTEHQIDEVSDAVVEALRA